jgi:hypothetical protein
MTHVWCLTGASILAFRNSTVKEASCMQLWLVFRMGSFEGTTI